MENNTEIGQFLDFLADAILIIDETSKIVYTNRSCTKLFGYEKDALIGLSVERLMIRAATKNHDHKVTNFIKNQSSAKVMMSRNIMPCINADGTEFNARISIANIVYQGKACAVATIQDYSTVQNMIDDLTNEASTDPLTGLFNKRHLECILDKDYFSVNGSTTWGVAFLDLNGFKVINDTYGHDVGDELLVEISRRLTQDLRAGDFSFRVGGDEFLLMFGINTPEKYQNSVAVFGQKIQKLITQPIYIESVNKELSIGVSIGLGVMPFDDKDLATLITKADKAMYESKVYSLPYVMVESIG
ncbi:sensor domain-containing diguanylate cyclase [Vibrio tapetis]|uniref:Uncharacterized protein n=1 Tax=Vibrio tapetis subsp. tapetis TaxID=1671868 RepID=A0A2N8ZD87_9VIBR|nr:sensor domain-containing diguanylate cyclase [Vibrio tapetis]SON49879.1 conserved protein of unknown function [Vibrio tapetis subsp. tapetis]